MTTLNNLNKRLKRLEEHVVPKIEEEELETAQSEVEYSPIAEAMKIKEILDEWKGYRWNDKKYARVGRGDIVSYYGTYGNLQLRGEFEAAGFTNFDKFSDEKIRGKALDVWKKLFNEKELRKLLNKLEDCKTVSAVEKILTPEQESSLNSNLKKYRAEVRKIVKNKSKKNRR